ncbi:MAG: cysteine--tRNA ligase [Nanoarchaeota archaeon]|nr:cysteine--tRNA ligase [Nanoarchaeota archaeon]MBU4351868.1 cysteine--tRNA ligase [Nanoarchaeota archaeon]
MLKIFNSFTRKKEEFKPIKEGHVKMYTCGPTVYLYAHIGNFRAYVFEDVLRRYLKFKGFKVTQVMNITDVDDKTIRDSQAQKKSLKEFTEFYTKAFFEDIKKLNIEEAEYYPKATDHIKEMVALIQKLLDKGFAYKSEDGSIYFKVSKFPNYGNLAHMKIEELKVGDRVKHDEYEKESVSDFALWKAWDKNDGNVFWETELGKGRPGWHIECSAMSMKYLGETFDIHTGGIDNLFPHHENEVAQAEAATGKKFVNYWMHCEHLLVENKKMSKSLGNFYTLRDLLEKEIKANAIRFLLLSTHYKQQLNFNFAGLEASKNAVQRLNDFALMLKNVSEEGTLTEGVRGIVDNSGQEFVDAMDDDLNISQALAVVFDMMKKINKVEDLNIDSAAFVYGQLLKFDSILGVLDTEEKVLDEDIQKMIDEREHARLNKEYDKADMIRDMLKEKGIILEDTADGIRWKRVS